MDKPFKFFMCYEYQVYGLWTETFAFLREINEMREDRKRGLEEGESETDLKEREELEIVYRMPPNFCETKSLWILVMPYVPRKYWPQKFYYLMMKVFYGYKYFMIESKSFLPSPNGKLSCTCIIPSQSIYSTVYGELWQISLLLVTQWALIPSDAVCHQLPSYRNLTLNLYAKTETKTESLSCMNQVLLWPSEPS